MDDSYDCLGINYYGNKLENETKEDYAKRNNISIVNPYTYANYFWGENDNLDIKFKHEENCWNKCCIKTIIKKRYLIQIVS